MTHIGFPIAFPHPFGVDSTPYPVDLPGGSPGSTVVTDNQIVSLHTRTGVQLFQFRPSDYSSLTWTRTVRDVSRCVLVAPPDGDVDRFTEIAPWVHWLSVFDGDAGQLLWTGPVRKPRINRRGVTLECRDASSYLMKTRTPITKRWEAADPAWIAGELWDYMIEQKNLGSKSIIRTNPQGDRFDFQSKSDVQMLDQTINDLVQLGLVWSIVSGVPVLGPMPLESVVSLGEQHFMGDPGIELVIDGTDMCNDVLVRGQGNLARSSTDMYGEHLEAVVTIDSISGVSNVQGAADEYVRNTSTFRRSLETPDGVTLHPEAPISISQLIPSTRLVINAYGIQQLVEVETVSVSRTGGQTTVGLTLDAVVDTPELTDKNLNNPTRSGQAT